MNASMNDTHNLGSCPKFLPALFVTVNCTLSLIAWKLVHVLRGWADISLLKTVRLGTTS
jgi:hypothetical protein